MQGLDLMDSGAFDLSDWDQRLPPPAAKTAVQTLTVVVISAEQAGGRRAAMFTQLREMSGVSVERVLSPCQIKV